MPLVPASSFRQWVAGAADLLASRLTVASREALTGHYFLLGWHIEIAPLVLSSHGSPVAATFNGTSHPGLRSSQMDSLLVCSTLVLVYVGSRSFGTFAEWRCF